MSLSGRLAVVTGGASGIGKCVCKALAKEGATVVVADINLDGACEVARSLPGKEGEEKCRFRFLEQLLQPHRKSRVRPLRWDCGQFDKSLLDKKLQLSSSQEKRNLLGDQRDFHNQVQ